MKRLSVLALVVASPSAAADSPYALDSPAQALTQGEMSLLASHGAGAELKGAWLYFAAGKPPGAAELSAYDRSAPRAASSSDMRPSDP